MEWVFWFLLALLVISIGGRIHQPTKRRFTKKQDALNSSALVQRRKNTNRALHASWQERADNLCDRLKTPRL